MEQTFTLPIVHNGKEYSFEGELISTGYTYKIRIDISGQIITYEPDEERNFRAIVENADHDSVNKIDTGLLQAISEELVAIFTQ